MPDLKVSLEPVPAAGASRSKQRLLLRGKRRTMIKKLGTALTNIVNMDVREQAKAETAGYGAFLFKDSTNSRYDRAVSLLKQRVDDMLAARG